MWLAATAAVAGLQAVVVPEAQAQRITPTEQHIITMEMVAVPRRMEPLALNLPPHGSAWLRYRNNTGKSLPSVHILLKNTTIRTSTSSDGSFELKIPISADEQTLIFSSIGYVIEERRLSDIQQEEVMITLSLDTDTTGEFIIPDYPSHKPWPWRLRAGWRYLTQPFQRH
ncbi:carboxypeptidase-like regulatory domain-containing protein [Hymenobacter sp. BT188]|uniref:carboxypeptidase-like regulatory domain-containing protein n=1 Tax=Hymenobacter sp. BT188 TaxID=2763504 RepID=UPI001651A006|nr:carboxypeptidase-like regulatory domain-containing protein [Hymenobacter sp. BT188]